ncbi:MAG: dimethylsulfoxide reductase subunit B [Gemmatimonadetes bacterium]|nr:dimethylsulfoxide reductase subunit B [Gemmatimonadota bacterium]
MTPVGFSFDASACSGCKACQAACKDKNQLPVGVLWRRVYEVTGGGWTRAGETWTSDVFAYHLSIACNHCERPICVEVCPTEAMHRRDDGLVAIDREKCIGCQYCAWACPYDAPQYDRANGHMTKCDLCADHLAEGKPPACVAACPMRVLDAREGEGGASELIDGREGVSHRGPLPHESLTRPALMIQPHQAAQRAGVLGNAEEVLGAPSSENSLVAFTVLTQMAVGTTWWLTARGAMTPRATAVVAVLTLLGLLASLLHLGAPRNAWRAMNNLRASWLSREVLSAGVFAAALGVMLVTDGSGLWLANLAGAALLVSMVQVYRLRTVPAWNGQRTTISFVATTLLSGILLGEALTRTSAAWWVALAAALAAAALARRAYYASRTPHGAWRWGE